MLYEGSNKKDVVVSIIIISAALIIYFKGYNLSSGVFITSIAMTAFLIREIGQRTVSRWMDAYVETKLSRKGTGVTLFISLISAITSLPVIWLIPTINSFSQKKHEHWGKSVDSMWSKREYWIASGGITALSAVSLTSLALSQTQVTQALTAYTLSQLVPLRDSIVEGDTDGAYILFHSGFTWLIFTGINIVVITSASF
jgi:hypothetical protein